MPVFFQYLIKLSISLAIMYLFYQLVLRRLTFYNHNRWYLFGYSVLCFFISFINVGPILDKSDASVYGFVSMVPAVESFTFPAMGAAEPEHEGWNIWTWAAVSLATGTAFFILRLVIQIISFSRLKSRATLVNDEGIRFYQVNAGIMPFSFGRSIFVNQNLHTEAELKDIVRHEFVHVKHGHTVDIIWSEILCMLNWFNPFAWLIRKAIRQNLEFLADSKVISHGVDKMQYQLLLLKVTGNHQYDIAAPFNFSSLKKRIIMMNKISSARIHLVKFLFVLPLLAVLLLAFRNGLPDDDLINPSKHEAGSPGETAAGNSLKNVIVKEPGSTLQVFADENGDLRNNVPSMSGFTMESMVKELQTGARESEQRSPVKKTGYGNLTDTVPSKARVSETGASRALHRDDGMSAAQKEFFERNREINLLYWKKDGSLEVYLNTGKVEKYASTGEMEQFEKKYGTLPEKNSSSTLNKENPGLTDPMGKKNNLLLKTDNLYMKSGKQKPLVYVDGKEWPSEFSLNLINGASIESLNIYKGESATKLYGDKGKDGVIAIVTKKPADAPLTEMIGQPVYYINGKKVSRQTLDLIDPTKIQSIDVLKGKNATDKYGDDGKNGVIEITIPVV